MAMADSQFPPLAPGDPSRSLAELYWRDGYLAAREFYAPAVSPVGVEGEDEAIEKAANLRGRQGGAWPSMVAAYSFILGETKQHGAARSKSS